MDIYRWLVEEWESGNLIPHIEDDIRTGAFEMNAVYEQLVQAIQPLEATKRVIFRCKTCKKIRTCDYVEYQGKFYRLQPWDDGFNIQTPEQDLRCTCGSKNVLSGGVVGTVTHKHCNERCETASNLVCNCSCGGANHGIAYKEK